MDYEKIIKQLTPKPRFNLEWYKGCDDYSDGDVEDIIVDIIVNNEPENYSKAISEHFNWPVFYHLHNIRKNILNWYPFDSNASVLEIGCGPGAITGMLCDKVESVTAVEISKRRAFANLIRCREKDNLEIIVGNLNDIEFEKKYDYITLIGVLEYQGIYTEGENPYCDFLRKIKKLLTPNGKLLIGIENKFGLKYWCGAWEDHSAVPFDGINDYRYIDGKRANTFSKSALDIIIKNSGFKNTYYYYPMPDYKLPNVVFSEKTLPTHQSIKKVKPYYTTTHMSLVAKEDELYKEIINNNAFEFFANSFLVECSDGGDIGKVTYALMNSERQNDYQLGTRFIFKECVEKFALNKAAKGHLDQMAIYENSLKIRGLDILPGEKIDDFTRSVIYCSDKLLDEVLYEAYLKNNRENIYKIWDMLCDEVIASSDEVSPFDNAIIKYEIATEKDAEKFGRINRHGYIDMIFRNAFFGESIVWFDQEWMIDNVPARYIIYRNILTFYMDHEDCKTIVPKEEIMEYFGISNQIEEYEALEDMFMNTVNDIDNISQRDFFSEIDPSTYPKSINKLLES